MGQTVGSNQNFDHPQQIWARQWNVEMHGDGPCIVNRGATLWSLGFMTKYESSKLLAANGAKTEILGAFIHPIGDIPEDRPIFENRNSSMSLVYETGVHRANHKIQVRDVRGEKVETIGNNALNRRGSRARMDLFVSDLQRDTNPGDR